MLILNDNRLQIQAWTQNRILILNRIFIQNSFKTQTRILKQTHHRFRITKIQTKFRMLTQISLANNIFKLIWKIGVIYSITHKMKIYSGTV